MTNPIARHSKRPTEKPNREAKLLDQTIDMVAMVEHLAGGAHPVMIWRPGYGQAALATSDGVRLLGVAMYSGSRREVVHGAVQDLLGKLWNGRRH